MDKEKKSFGSVAADAGKNALEFLDKAKKTLVNAVDQNNDGSLDLKDVSVLADTISSAAKSTATAVINGAEAKNREIEKRILQPIFADDLVHTGSVLTKLIRITEIDKKHAESDVCKGSIGFISDHKDLKVVNVFRNHVDAFGLTFSPDTDCEFYYVNPSNRDHYIALDNYFYYLKVERINELQKIAQDLGAKHFRVIYKEQKATFSKSTVKGKAAGKTSVMSVNAEAEHDLSASSLSSIEVAAEMTCPGHAPLMPTLHYLQGETCILNLITMRMNTASPLTHQKFTIKLSNSSGIKEKDALKIDAMLKAIKMQGNTTLISEVRNEARRFLEYEIDF